MNRRVLAMALSACFLTGCATLPRGGPVRAGEVQPNSSEPITFVAPGPSAADAPAEIVRGFLRAAADNYRGYDTAAEYLTPRARSAWQPDAATTVFATDSLVVATGDDADATAGQGAVGPSGEASAADNVAQGITNPGLREVNVSYDVIADVSSTGVMAASSERRSSMFRLAQTDQGWRIDGLDDGIVIADSLFNVAYAAYDVFFLDAYSDTLVPDVRWFARKESLATTLARSVVAGPAPHLARTLRSALPKGVDLAPPRAVRNENGTLIVDLSAGVDRVDDDQRLDIYRQFAATLQAGRGVSEVLIAVQGALRDKPAGANRIEDPATVELLSIRDQTLWRQRGGARGLSLPVAPLQASMGADGSSVDGAGPLTNFRIMSVDPTGTSVSWFADGAQTGGYELDDGTEVASAGFDDRGYGYVVKEGSDSYIQCVRERPRQPVVPLQAPGGLAVTAARVSPDSTQLAVAAPVSQDTEVAGSRLFIAGVIRDETGCITGLGETWRTLAVLGHGVTDLQWHGMEGVLAGAPATDESPARYSAVPLAGFPTERVEPPADSLRLIAGPELRELLSEQPDGSYRTLDGRLWLEAPSLLGSDAVFYGR